MRDGLLKTMQHTRESRRKSAIVCVAFGFMFACSGTTGEDKEDPSVESAETPITAQPDIDCDYAEHGGHEYWFCRNNREWDVAKDKCAAVGMHLARIDDAAENSFIYDNIFHSSWIGATDEGSEGDWSWIDDDAEFWTGGRSGSAASGFYANWDWWEPDDDQYQNCALINYYGGEWSDRYCGYEKDYVCESSDDTANYPQAPDTGCTLESLNGHEYWFCSDRRSFSEARTKCQSVGMDLANVENEAENEFIKDNIRRDSFIGLTDTEKEGVWKWITDGRLAWCGDEEGRAPGSAAYTNWHSSWFYGYPTVGADCRYETANDRGYWFCDDGRPWSRARSACESVGMSLARIDDGSENEYVYENIYWDVWLGATDSVEEGEWKWLYGDELFWAGGYHGGPVGGLYSHWAWGGPMDFHWANCLALSSWWGDWESWDCEDYLAWVCEGDETDDPELPDTMDCAKMQSCGGEWVNDECEDLAGYVCETVPETAGQSLEGIAKWIRDDFRTGRPIIRHLEFEDTAEVTEPFLYFGERLGLRECVDTVEPTSYEKYSHYYGHDITRYQQYYKGIPVQSGSYSVHREPGTENVRMFTGLVEHNIEVDVNPAVSEPNAFGLAIDAIGGDPSDYSPRPQGKLMIIPKRQGDETGWRLTWFFAVPPMNGIDGYTIGIDAHSGALAVLFPKTKYQCLPHVPDGTEQQSTLEVEAFQHTCYADEPKTVTVEQRPADGIYFLHTKGVIPVKDLTAEAALMDAPEMTAICDPATIPQDVVSLEEQSFEVDAGSPESHLAAAALMGVQRCVEYLASTWGMRTELDAPWIGTDGYGGSEIRIHATRDGNAQSPRYAHGSKTLVFDLDFSERIPFWGASIDIPCHEFSHAIWHENVPEWPENPDENVDPLAPPVLEGLSIEEAFADIVGAATEMFIRGYTDPENGSWCVGGDAFGNDTCYRNIATPESSWSRYQDGGCPRVYLGTSYCSEHEIWCSPQQTTECCDPHCNSTVLSHWFYLVTQGGEGINDRGCEYNVPPLDSIMQSSVYLAMDILFQTIVNDYEPGMGFRQLADKTIDRARNEFDVDTEKMLTIVNAWYAVGVWDSFYEAHRPTVEPTRDAENLNPWTTFTWPAFGEETEWDFQLADGPFDENSEILFFKNGLDERELDLALPFEHAERLFWRVRPAGSTDAWNPCYPIHAIKSTRTPDEIPGNIEAFDQNSPDDGEVSPGYVWFRWNTLEHATQYKIQVSTRDDVNCEGGADVIETFAPRPDFGEDTQVWYVGGLQPSTTYYVYIQPIGPEDYVIDPGLRNGHCKRETFTTIPMRPPKLVYPEEGEYFRYQPPHRSGVNSGENLHWIWRGYDGAELYTANFYRRLDDGSCDMSALVLSKDVPQEFDNPYNMIQVSIGESLFPLPNGSGYCWTVTAHAANEDTSTSPESSFQYYLDRVKILGPGVQLAEAEQHDPSPLTGNNGDTYGREVSLTWEEAENAIGYMIKVGHWPWNQPFVSPDPIHCYGIGCIHGPLEDTYREFVQGGSVTLTGDQAGKGRYCWTIWPVLEDPEIAGAIADGRQPLVDIYPPYCYTTGPAEPRIDPDEETMPPDQGFTEKDIEGVIELDYIPDGQYQIELVSNPEHPGDFELGDWNDKCIRGPLYFNDYIGCKRPFIIHPHENTTYELKVHTWNCPDSPTTDDNCKVHTVPLNFATGSCGSENEICCDNSTCDDYLVCDKVDEDDVGTCKCGAQNQPCCGGEPDGCGDNLVCTTNKECHCSDEGQPCCNGNYCNAGLDCYGEDNKTCECGGHNQKKCSDGSCDDGHVLVGEGDEALCKKCGDSGDPCCAGAVCNGDLDCSGNECQEPPPEPASLSLDINSSSNTCGITFENIVVTNTGGMPSGTVEVMIDCQCCAYVDFTCGSSGAAADCGSLEPGDSVNVREDCEGLLDWGYNVSPAEFKVTVFMNNTTQITDKFTCWDSRFNAKGCEPDDCIGCSECDPEPSW